jgi:DNA-binding NarL/FixJ family response regulator
MPKPDVFGNSLTRRQRAALKPVTAREQQVIDLVVQGYRNEQIALHLRISLNTVKKHLVTIFDKMQVTQRGQLADLEIQRLRKSLAQQTGGKP